MSAFTFDKDGNPVLAIGGWEALPPAVQALYGKGAATKTAKAVRTKSAAIRLGLRRNK